MKRLLLLILILVFGCGGGGGGDSVNPEPSKPIVKEDVSIVWEKADVPSYQIFVDHKFVDEVVMDEWYIDDMEVNKEYKVDIRGLYGDEAEPPVKFTLIIVKNPDGCKSYEIVPDAGYENNFDSNGLLKEVCGD